MITYEEVIALGWEDRYPDFEREENHNTFVVKEEHGHHMMSLFLKPDKEGFHACMIVWVDEKVKVNEWENADHAFYGVLKTADDLKNVMRYCSVIEY